MGIVEFFKNYIRELKYPVLRRQLPGGADAGVEGVVFDLNGMLHSVAQSTFMYGEGYNKAKYDAEVRSGKPYRKYLDDYVVNLGTELSRVIASLSPRQYVIICVDGIAPAAKIFQQRTRRYRAADEAAQTADGGGHPPPLAGFKIAFISPGTAFMNTVDTYLRGWIIAQRKAYVDAQAAAARKRRQQLGDEARPYPFPPVILYSSHEISGEGEHKAFYHLREMLADFSIRQGRGFHVVYGKDADLALLSLVSPVKRIMILREDFSQVISIDDLYDSIRGVMLSKAPEHIANSFPREILTRDFITIAALVGNDFLPKNIAFDAKIIGSSLLDAYSELRGAPLTRVTEPDSVSPSTEIILSTLGNFFSILALREPELLKRRALIETESIGKVYERTLTSTLQSNFSPSTGGVDMTNFRAAWYTQMLKMYKKSVEMSDGRVPESIRTLRDFMKSVVCEYLATINWYVIYYTGGGQKINWLHSYRYHLAPTITDLANIITSNYAKVAEGTPDTNSVYLTRFYEMFCGRETGGGGFTSETGPEGGRGKSYLQQVHQLLVITPPSVLAETSGSTELAETQRSDPYLAAISPPAGRTEYYVESFRKDRSHEFVPILPAVDLRRVVTLVKKLQKEHYDEYSAETARAYAEIRAGIRPPPPTRIVKGEEVPGSLPKYKPLFPRRLENSDTTHPIYVQPPLQTRIFNARVVGKTLTDYTNNRNQPGDDGERRPYNRPPEPTNRGRFGFSGGEDDLEGETDNH